MTHATRQRAAARPRPAWSLTDGVAHPRSHYPHTPRPLTPTTPTLPSLSPRAHALVPAPPSLPLPSAGARPQPDAPAPGQGARRMPRTHSDPTVGTYPSIDEVPRARPLDRYGAHIACRPRAVASARSGPTASFLYFAREAQSLARRRIAGARPRGGAGAGGCSVVLGSAYSAPVGSSSSGETGIYAYNVRNVLGGLVGSDERRKNKIMVF